MQSSAHCPYCGEENLIEVDEAGGRRQQYVEDCQVCCQPWDVIATVDEDGEIVVQLRTLDE